MQWSECEFDCMYLKELIPGALRVATNKEGPFAYIAYISHYDERKSERYPEQYRGYPIVYHLQSPRIP